MVHEIRVSSSVAWAVVISYWIGLSTFTLVALYNNKDLVYFFVSEDEEPEAKRHKLSL